MTNVLIIASDMRMAELRNKFQPLLGALILLVTDFDLGLKEVFEKRPSIVFIQDDIDGVSGATVARHIKTLLRDQSPRMILLSGKGAVPKTANSWFDEVLPLSGTEQSLHDAFKRLLDATQGLVWKEITPEFSDFSVDQAEDEEGIPEILGNSEPVVPEPFPEEFSPLPIPEVPQPSAEHQQADAENKRAALDTAREKLLSPGTLKPAGEVMTDVTAAPPSPPRYRPVAQPGVPPPEEHAWDDLVPHGEPVNGRSLQGSRLWIYGTGFVVAVVIALYFYLHTMDKPVSPVTPQVSPVSRQATGNETPGGITLPSFIASGTIDRVYGASHPGWERYVSSTGSMEYLVFRERGAIKALQMIALKEAVIDDQFIRTALRDLSGNDTYRLTGSSEKKGFLVESGTAAGNAEILVYRKGKSSVPVAFVITFR